MLREIAATPERCAYYFEGFNCYALGPEREGIAPTCRAVHETLDLEKVSARTVPVREYHLPLHTPPSRSTIDFTLYRVNGPKRSQR